ncbi:hypothetical protein ACFW0P_16750 [Lysobacter soli]|uniref:hypothetical protein n=1 Tax=Lysobacter soli TaxID=453783 RepID=UPI0036903044
MSRSSANVRFRPEADIWDTRQTAVASPEKGTLAIRELLADFVGSIASAASDAPDNYPDWLPKDWTSHRADLLDLWGRIHPGLKRDVDQAAALGVQVTAMIDAFDSGDREAGREIAWDIFNSQPEKLR